MYASYKQLSVQQLATPWFNAVPSMPTDPPPPLHPATMQPIGPDDLAPLFPMALLGQEVSTQEWIDIPGPILDVYRTYRPSPLFRARRLEAYLGTPARLYYKYEGVSPAGSHQPNTAIAQGLLQQGRRREAPGDRDRRRPVGLRPRNGLGLLRPRMSGLHGRRLLPPEARPPDHDGDLGGPGDLVALHRNQAGKAILAQDPDSPGSLGIAISEAVEDAAKREDTKYALGSVLNYVLLHQSVIGLEARQQMEMAGDYPDVIIGCVGGDSNFAGLAFPFVPDKTRHGRDLRFLWSRPPARRSPRDLRVRLRRHRRNHAPDRDAYPGEQLAALGHRFIAPHPRRGPALPRRCPGPLPSRLTRHVCRSPELLATGCRDEGGAEGPQRFWAGYADPANEAGPGHQLHVVQIGDGSDAQAVLRTDGHLG